MARPPKIPDGLKLRGKTYYAWLTYKGQTIRKALSKNRDAASDILNDIIARIDRRDYGFTDNEAVVEDVKKQYLEHCKQSLKKGSADRYESCLDQILTTLAVDKVSQITPKAIITYRQGRLDKGRSPRTVNMEVGALQTMLRWAVRFQLIGSSPIGEIKPLPHDNPKEGRALTHEEVERLLESSSQHWREIWHAFLVTGMRRGELSTLTWRDVDWEAREIVVRGSVAKNRTSRRIPIEDELYAILERRFSERNNREPGQGPTPAHTERVRAKFTTENVFTTTQNSTLTLPRCLYDALLRCCKDAGIVTRTFDEAGDEIDHVDVHSLRRTFATNLITSGADPKTVQELMGHKSLVMTMGLYAKINTTNRRSAVAKLSYGTGAAAPNHVVTPSVPFNKKPKAQRMRTNAQAVAVAST